MTLISYEEALQRVLSLARPAVVEHVALTDALGRVLAQPVTAQSDLPPFDNAAVDGYALSEPDTREGVTVYAVGAETRAGDPARSGAWPRGEAVRVFTGAPVPPRTGAVVMQEDVRVEGDRIALADPPEFGSHVRRRGEERRRGDVVLPSSRVLGPASIAAAAAAGVAHVPVVKVPAIGILATGNELVAPGDPLRDGQVYEANASALASAVLALGLPRPLVARVADDEGGTTEAVLRLAEHADVLVVTGGVSVGSYDYVKPALTRAGFESVFWGVRMKPGKPFYAGVREGPRRTVCFGLPGNPLSTLVTWSVLVRPFLQAWHGLAAVPERATARCTETIRRKPGRREFVPAVFESPRQDSVRPLGRRASHMLGAAAEANALIVLDEDQDHVSEGEWVNVLPWNWRLE